MLRVRSILVALSLLASVSAQIIKDATFTAKPVDLGILGTAKTEIVWSPCSNHLFVVDKSGLLTVVSKTAGQTGFVYNFKNRNYQYADHGPLGMQLHPQFPAQPYLFMYYTAEGTNPATGQPWGDACPRVIGGRQFCKVTSKLERYKLDVTVVNGVCNIIKFTPGGDNPFLLKEDWCSSSLTHGNGDARFYGNDLLLTSGDGGQAGGVDVGIPGSDLCYDTAKKMPQGKLRSQRLDFLNGKLLLIPAAALMKTTGQLTVGAEIKIVARGLRQAYSTAVDKYGNVYIGDVGSKLKEEINMLTKAEMGNAVAYPYNFGWPCIQGSKYITETGERDWLQKTCNPATAATGGCDLCKDIYPCATGGPGCSGKWRKPVFEFRNTILDQNYPAECTQTTSAITGLAFLNGTPLGGGAKFTYNLIANDYGTGCMWYFTAKADGTPNFAGGAHLLVTDHKAHWLGAGKDNYVYSARLENFGTWWQHGPKSANDGPTANLQILVKNPTTGAFANCGTGACQVPVGATVRFDARASSPGGSAITGYTYNWGAGAPFASALATADHVYPGAGSFLGSVTVTDAKGMTGIATRTIVVGSGLAITMTPATNLWKLGDKITYSLVATGFNPPITAAQVEWSLIISHCGLNKCNGQADCHFHTDGVNGANNGLTGTFTPPQHDLPSFMVLTADVTLSSGLVLSTSANTHCLQWQATLQAAAGGVPIAGFVIDNGEVFTGATPFIQPFMAKSAPTLIAREVQAKTAKIYKFVNWKKTLANGVTSNAGSTPLAATNNIPITENNMKITANYERVFPAISTTAATPKLVAVAGFYKSIEVVWVVPTGVLWDNVVVSVKNVATGADFSVVVPTAGDDFTSVSVPAGIATYNVMLAGYNYAKNTMTKWGQVRTITSSGDANKCEYPTPGPYAGTSVKLPGTVEFEEYALGGNNVGYYDTTPGNQGGANFRTGYDVDVQTGGLGGYSVTGTAGNEWLQYYVTVATTRNYQVTFRVASVATQRKDLFLNVDSAVCQQALAVASFVQTGSTGSTKTFITINVANVPLTAGKHVLRFCVTGGAGGIVLDSMTFT